MELTDITKKQKEITKEIADSRNYRLKLIDLQIEQGNKHFKDKVQRWDNDGEWFYPETITQLDKAIKALERLYIEFEFLGTRRWH